MRRGDIANDLTNALSVKTVCNSRAVFESFDRWERYLLNRDRIAIILNGVNFDRVSAGTALDWSVTDDHEVDPEAVIVGNAAMLTHHKAQDVLIRTVARASEDGEVPIELVIAGDGPLGDALQNLVEVEEFVGSIHFLGCLGRSYIYRMMDEVDVYTIPSRWEGFSAAAEALATGTHCVFSDIEQFTEPFEDVAVFHPMDDVGAHAEPLRTLAENQKFRETLGDESRRLVDSCYSVPAIAAQ